MDENIRMSKKVYLQNEYKRGKKKNEGKEEKIIENIYLY
jgi:hypothetical protein